VEPIKVKITFLDGRVLIGEYASKLIWITLDDDFKIAIDEKCIHSIEKLH